MTRRTRLLCFALLWSACSLGIARDDVFLARAGLGLLLDADVAPPRMCRSILAAFRNYLFRTRQGKKRSFSELEARDHCPGKPHRIRQRM